MTGARIRPGRPSPLGATPGDTGINFALYSEHATRIELCLFASPNDERESERIALPEKTNQVWHGFVPGLKPGQIYGYRVHGPYAPERGHRFNPRKILLDHGGDLQLAATSPRGTTMRLLFGDAACN